MVQTEIYGYVGRILRVDLNKGRTASETLDEVALKKYVGGATLRIKFIYDEVPPEVEWSDAENRLFIGSGPLGGTRIGIFFIKTRDLLKVLYLRKMSETLLG